MTDEELSALGFMKNEHALYRRMPVDGLGFNDSVDVVDEYGNIHRGEPAGMCFISPCIYTHWRPAKSDA